MVLRWKPLLRSGKQVEALLTRTRKRPFPPSRIPGCRAPTRLPAAPPVERRDRSAAYRQRVISYMQAVAALEQDPAQIWTCEPGQNHRCDYPKGFANVTYCWHHNGRYSRGRNGKVIAQARGRRQACQTRARWGAVAARRRPTAAPPAPHRWPAWAPLAACRPVPAGALPAAVACRTAAQWWQRYGRSQLHIPQGDVF